MLSSRGACGILAWLAVLAGCTSLPSAKQPPLSGELVDERYTAPRGAWSVDCPAPGLGWLTNVTDDADGTGGWFVTWHDPNWGSVDVWVAPVESAATSVEALGSVEQLADMQSANRVRELERAGASVRILSRAAAEVQGRAAMRHVYEIVPHDARPRGLAPIGFGSVGATHVEVVDVADWGDALVRFTGRFELEPTQPDASWRNASPVTRAQALIAEPERTFARPAVRQASAAKPQRR